MSKKTRATQLPSPAALDAASAGNAVTSIPAVKAVYFIAAMDIAGQKRRTLFADDKTTMELCCVYNACFLRVRSSAAGVELIPVCHVFRLVVDADEDDEAS
jgi:hypothetical protein